MPPLKTKSPGASQAAGTQATFDEVRDWSEVSGCETNSQADQRIELSVTDLPRVTIACDGGASPNPGPAGWAYVMDGLCGHSEAFGHLAHATNNIAEITALIRALEALEVRSQVVINTDSQYLQKGLNQWISMWKRRGWRTKKGRPVANRELWERLDALREFHVVTCCWVRGNGSHLGNLRADYLAGIAIKQGALKGRGGAA
jgi:ribonuclease HI